ncbi:MAG: peptidyl-prolyl cis-trans isomerase [Planctomycetes bacterium]|nr:peptidyl-prolyl cis-trans isomerase [Planctomycetota bacterium]
MSRLRPNRPTVSALLCLTLSAGMIGCAAGSSSDQKRQTALKPSDFAGTPTTQPAPKPKPTPTPTPTPKSAPTAGATPDAPAATGPARDESAGNPGDAEVERDLNSMRRPTITAAPNVPEGSYVVDAMVGQVNGRAIYADSALEPIARQLAALGNTQTRSVFRDRARMLILSRIDQIVADALILGEAERDLNQMEQEGLRNILREQREEFLRQFGQGSVAVADETLMEREGRTLDQRMTAEREKILIQRYLRQKLLPKINVTRKDVERYYRDNAKKYNPEPGRTIRIIRVSSTAAADRVDKHLAEGKPFTEVASMRDNTYQREQGGLMASNIVGDNPFGPEPLNVALKTLSAGQHSQRIKIGSDYWWLLLESVETGKQQTLTQAQLEIEDILRRQRFQVLSARYRQRLFAEGTYNPIEQMADALLQVALTRYAAPE